MTKYFFVAFLILTLTSCSSNYEVENKLYECLLKDSKSKSFDIIPLLNKFEKDCIENSILANSTGKEKKKFYQQIVRKGEIPFMPQSDVADSLSQLKMDIKAIESCAFKKGIDSNQFKKSKYYQLSQELGKLSEINPKSVSNCYIKILDESDFDHPFFRAFTLIIYSKIYDANSKYIKK